MSDDALLEVRRLRTFYYTKRGDIVRAVDGVSFKLRRNDSLALVGESGCGKSTTAHTIMRLLPPNARIVDGKVLFNGKVDLTKIDEDVLR